MLVEGQRYKIARQIDNPYYQLPNDFQQRLTSHIVSQVLISAVIWTIYENKFDGKQIIYSPTFKRLFYIRKHQEKLTTILVKIINEGQ